MKMNEENDVSGSDFSHAFYYWLQYILPRGESAAVQQQRIVQPESERYYGFCIPAILHHSDDCNALRSSYCWRVFVPSLSAAGYCCCRTHSSPAMTVLHLPHCWPPHNPSGSHLEEALEAEAGLTQEKEQGISS